MVLAIDYVKEGLEVEVRYDEGWFRGVVQKVIKHTANMCVEASILYENETIPTIEQLFEADFDNVDSQDNWTFVCTPAVRFVREMINADRQLHELVTQVEHLQETVRELNCNSQTAKQSLHPPKRSAFLRFYDLIYLVIILSMSVFIAYSLYPEVWSAQYATYSTQMHIFFNKSVQYIMKTFNHRDFLGNNV